MDERYTHSNGGMSMFFTKSGSKGAVHWLLLVATVVSAAGCGKRWAAQAAQGPASSNEAGKGGSEYHTPSATPEEDRKAVLDFLASGPDLSPGLDNLLEKTANQVFRKTFPAAKDLRGRSPSFKCNRAGCSLEVAVKDMAAVEELDRKLLTPASPLLRFPGILHRTGIVKSERQSVVLWALLAPPGGFPGPEHLRSLLGPDKKK